MKTLIEEGVPTKQGLPTLETPVGITQSRELLKAIADKCRGLDQHVSDLINSLDSLKRFISGNTLMISHSLGRISYDLTHMISGNKALARVGLSELLRNSPILSETSSERSRLANSPHSTGYLMDIERIRNIMISGHVYSCLCIKPGHEEWRTDFVDQQLEAVGIDNLFRIMASSPWPDSIDCRKFQEL